MLSTKDDPKDCLQCGFLDYYDIWVEIDPRLEKYSDLRHAAGAFGHDIVHLATYVYDILNWLKPKRIQNSMCVMYVGAMTEAALVSIRSAYDAVAMGLAQVATAKRGQAPTTLAELVNWARKNPSRIDPKVRELLAQEHEAFWFARRYRDYVVHRGADIVIHTDRHQFNLNLRAEDEWLVQEPLIPMLARHIKHLIEFANEAATIVNAAISLPPDRVGSRIVNGRLIHALHQLQEVQHDYARPWPRLQSG